MSETDPWAWAHEHDSDPTPATRPAAEQDWSWAQQSLAHQDQQDDAVHLEAGQVALLLVTHQGARWLRRTLRAVAGLDTRPGQIIVVDANAGAPDPETSELLDQALADGVVDQVIQGPDEGFGAAVAAATPNLDDQVQWLWFLHDDSEPTPSCLDHLLERAAEPDHPALLFPKLLLPRRRNYPDRISEIGASVAPSSSRFLAHMPGDIDQRQSDSSAVLGGSTAGLLVRREAFEALGGFDPALPLFRDGLDLGWRANARDLLVVTCPSATLHHHQAARLGLRTSSVIDDPVAADRQWGMRAVAAHSQHPVRTLGRMRLRARARAAGYLLGKAPQEARAELVAARRAGRDAQVVEAMAARTTPGAGHRLLPSRRERTGAAVDALLARFDQGQDADSDTSIDDLTGDDFTGGMTQRRVVTPGRVLALVLVVVSAIISFRFWGTGQLVGPELNPAPLDWGQAWQRFLQPAPGHAGSNAPWLFAMALASTITLGHPEILVRILVIGAPLLAGWSAYRVVRRRLAPGWSAASVAACWAGAGALVGITWRGSLAGAVALVVLPLAAGAVWRWWRTDQADARWSERVRGGAMAAFWFGVLAWFVPVWAFVLVAVVAVRAALQRRVSLADGVALLGVLAMVGPWWVRLFADRGRLLTGTDPTQAETASGTWQQGSAPLWIAALAAVLWIGALVVAWRQVRPGRRAPFVALVTGAICAFALAAWLRIPVLRIDGVAVRAGLDVWLLTGIGCLLLAVVLVLAPQVDVVSDEEEWLGSSMGTVVGTTTLRARWTGTQHLVTGLVGGIAALGLVWLVVGTAAAPLHVGASPVPAYVSQAQQSQRATRTLVVWQREGQVRWTLTQDQNPSWGSGEQHPVLGNRQVAVQVGGLASQIASGTAGDQFAASAAALGIGHVVLDTTDANRVAAINNVPGLVRADDPGSGPQVWTVLVSSGPGRPQVGVSRVVGPSGPVADAQVPSGQVRIAEVPDPRWQVSVDDHKVPVQGGGTIGITGTVDQPGHLHWWMDRSWGALIWLVATMVVLGLLAAPTASRFTAGQHQARRMEVQR